MAGDPGYAERKGSKTKAPKIVESVHIKRAENGFIVRCSHPPAPAKRGECAAWEPDREYAFSTYDEVNAFADKAFGKGEK